MTEFLLLLIYAAAGIAAGVFTGLVPGLHINTITAGLFGVSAANTVSKTSAVSGGLGTLTVPDFPAAANIAGLDPLNLSIFVVAMAVTNSFFEFVPAIFLGAPDPDSVLGVLPGHRLLMEGRGHEALQLTTMGGLAGVALLAATLPTLVIGLPLIYAPLRGQMHLILAGLMGLMIALEAHGKRLIATGVFLLSGVFGVLALWLPLPEGQALFPILSGLFGLSTIAVSIKSTVQIPTQDIHATPQKGHCFVGGGLGFLGGVLAGILPGFGSAQSAILVQELGRAKSSETFLAAQGAINSSNILLSILALYLIGNPRSGAAVFIGQIITVSFWHVLLFVGVGLLSAGIAAACVLVLGKHLLPLLARANYTLLSLAVAVGIAVAIFYFTGLIGLGVAAAGTLIGILPPRLGVKKSLCLGCLILPTILWFAGVRI